MKKAAENKLASNAKLRSVNTKFWDDPYIIDLDPIEKLLFLYFLTNPLTNLAGVYEISLKRIAFDTGIDKDMVLKIIDRFEVDGKMFFRDGFIILVNYQKNQKFTEPMKINVRNTIAALPTEIREFYIKIAKQSKNTLCIPYRESEGESEEEGEVESEGEEEGEVESEGEEEDSLHTSHDSHSLEIPAPLLTDLTDYLPQNINDDDELRLKIEDVIKSFTGNSDKATISQHFNLITKPLQCNRETAFKIFFEFFSNYSRLKPSQQNFSYAYKSVKGKINDYEIRLREEKAGKQKTEDRATLNNILTDSGNLITQAASEIKKVYDFSNDSEFQELKGKRPVSKKFDKQYGKGGFVN